MAPDVCSWWMSIPKTADRWTCFVSGFLVSNGPGVHLIFTIPDDVTVATNRGLGTGSDVPHSVLLPGSEVKLDDGTERRYKLTVDIDPAPSPLAMIASVALAKQSRVRGSRTR